MQHFQIVAILPQDILYSVMECSTIQWNTIQYTVQLPKHHGILQHFIETETTKVQKWGCCVTARRKIRTKCDLAVVMDKHMIQVWKS